MPERQIDTTTNETSQRLQSLKEKLENDNTAKFFGLTLDEISDLLSSINFTGGGISPMFLSPGYGRNGSLRPQVQMTRLSNRPDTYLHESRHGLHLKVCNIIFERPEMILEAFRMFCENVLGDQKFIQQIKQSGSALQKEFIENAYQLQKNTEQSPENIRSFSTQLGALTYQHAYFVDPRMIEAVASFMDTGATRVIGDINRVMAGMIPYHSTFALKGYGDRKSQKMFERSDLIHKALLVKREDYRREQFFKQ
ncbi:hypothetical protein HYU91_00235 [Candidatus Collierbacteria bacterium]|nr:hypothetical protein [Candidatus Collierbacteria bacterium]